jgi:hypothetical protein
MDSGLQEMGAQPDSKLYQGGKLATEIAGTSGVGGFLAKGVGMLSQTPKAVALANALRTGGMTAGKTPGLANMATRVTGGTLSGGAMAGLVDPNDAGTGAIIGGTMPPAFKVAGEAGKVLNNTGRAVLTNVGVKTAPVVSPEVSALYQKAKSLGIDIPTDRILNNRLLNAGAASLNYVPMSGRMATEDNMLSQVNRALSRTFGQDSDNVTMALRKASKDLGGKFDDTLRNNSLSLDNTFLDELATHDQTVSNELGNEGSSIIKKQIDTILNKVDTNGMIDGQTAYNIKKRLDIIGQRNTPEAFYARDLKKSLMGALNRSLGPDKAEEFSQVRKQYGNMLDLEGIAQNGAEGGVSIARLANMKNINNPDLQDLADISAQFLKTRESQHGAMQRVVMGGLGAAGAAGGAATGTLPLIGGAMALGRGTNMLLNNSMLKNSLADRPELLRQFLKFSSNPIARGLPIIGGPGLLK